MRVCRGAGVRAVATLIDAGVIFVACMFVWLLLVNEVENRRIEPNGLWPFAAAGLAVAFVYCWAWEGASGSTPGKWLFHLRVVLRDGARAGAGAALVRTLLRIVDFLPLFYLLGLLAVRRTPRRQRIGDVVAGAVVVRPEMVSVFRLDDPTVVRWLYRPHQ